MRSISVESLVGITIKEIRYNDYNESIEFTTTEDRSFRMLHDQSCCENVYVESIVGDLADLVGEPLLLAEEVSSDDTPPLSDTTESYTWTFYKFATRKGYVDIRWYGSSNGYYSEGVSLYEY